MQTLKQILVSLLQRITKYAHTTVYIGFLIAFLFLYTQYREFNGRSLQIRTYTDPIVRAETKTVYKDRVIEKQTQCVQTKVIIPNEKQETQLKEDFKFNPSTQIPTSIFDLKALKNGGTALTSINKETGETELTIKQNPRKFFGWGEGWTYYAGVEGISAKQIFGGAGKNLVRVGDGNVVAGLMVFRGTLTPTIHYNGEIP